MTKICLANPGFLTVILPGSPGRVYALYPPEINAASCCHSQSPLKGREIMAAWRLMAPRLYATQSEADIQLRSVMLVSPCHTS